MQLLAWQVYTTWHELSESLRPHRCLHLTSGIGLSLNSNSPVSDDDDEDVLSLELPDLSGRRGLAVGRCRCRMSLASPTTRCVWYQVPGTPCISSHNDVSECFVGSSLRMDLAPLQHSWSQRCARRFASDLPNQIPFSHAVSPLWSLFPDDNPRCSGATIMNKTVSTNGTSSCV